MLIRQVIRVVVFMAVNATEGHVVVRRGVALVAIVPSVALFVVAAVNRETIVVKIGRLPSRFRVALGAICRKARMARVVG